jgi:hypothetical protein
MGFKGKNTAQGDYADIRRVATGMSVKAFTKSVNANYDYCNFYLHKREC